MDAEAVKAELQAKPCAVLRSAVSDMPCRVLPEQADRCPEAASLMELVYLEQLLMDDGAEARWSGCASVMPAQLPHLDEALVKFKCVVGHEG